MRIARDDFEAFLGVGGESMGRVFAQQADREVEREG